MAQAIHQVSKQNPTKGRKTTHHPDEPLHPMQHTSGKDLCLFSSRNRQPLQTSPPLASIQKDILWYHTGTSSRLLLCSNDLPKHLYSMEFGPLRALARTHIAWLSALTLRLGISGLKTVTRPRPDSSLLGCVLPEISFHGLDLHNFRSTYRH